MDDCTEYARVCWLGFCPGSNSLEHIYPLIVFNHFSVAESFANVLNGDTANNALVDGVFGSSNSPVSTFFRISSINPILCGSAH